MTVHEVTDEELCELLTAATGQVFDQPELLAEWSRDWWPYGAKIPIFEQDLPAFAVMPNTVDEVAAVIRIAAHGGRAVLIRGGGTNMGGAIQPFPGAILLDLRALNVIEPVDPRDCTVRVDAGVYGGELEDRLNEQGYTLDHDPDSLHLSTVGGWISTRARGAFSTGYGGIECLIDGLDVVLADGVVIQTTANRRHGAGPRLLDLFVGAHGTRGVITAATLRVRPVPDERRFRALAMPSFERGLDAIRTLLQRGFTPAAIRLYDRAALAQFATSFDTSGIDCLTLLVFDGVPEVIDPEERFSLDLLTAAGGRDLGAAPALEWYATRHRMDWFVDGNEREGSIADRIEVATNWSVLPDVIAAARMALSGQIDSVWFQATHFGRSYAVLSFVLFIREESDDRALEVYASATAALAEAVIAAGGSIDRHGRIGRPLQPWMRSLPGVEARLCGALKNTFDPARTLNPERSFPG